MPLCVIVLDFSNPALFTAETVQLLVRHGAVVLGLRGLSSMFGREEPPKAVDFDIAFNPREDGYQSPASSAMEVPHVVQYMIGLTALSTQIPVAVEGVRRWQWSLAISTFSRVDVSVVWFGLTLALTDPSHLAGAFSYSKLLLRLGSRKTSTPPQDRRNTI